MPPRETRPRRAAAAALLVWAPVMAWAAACSSPSEPEPVSDEPDPFPDARSVRLWMYSTGLVLEPSELVEVGFWVNEPDVSYDVNRCPPGASYSCPDDLRIAWWSSDRGVVTVGAAGTQIWAIRAVAPGEAVVWVQVESERDSALVRVASPEDAPGPRYTTIGAGESHTCALDDRGAAYCWGRDNYEALGRGSGGWWTRAGAPGGVRGGHAFAQLATGGTHACGLLASGEAWCWGKNFNGQVGNGELDRNRPLAYQSGVPEPEQVIGGITFDTLAAAGSATCGLAGGSAYCWGNNLNGELGIGSPDPQDDRPEPTAVSGDLIFALLVGGAGHFCGVTTADETYCWGEHNVGVFSNAPVLIAGAPAFVVMAAGFDYTCGLTASRETYCWGYNNRGQLGNDDLDGTDTPTLLAGGFEFVALAAGTRHTCGLTPAGEAYCWGENEYGQLGTGERNFDPNPTPQPVAGSLTFMSLTAGQGHTCAITTDGAAYCWGALSNGQLGNGRVGEVSPPFGAGVPFSPVPVRVVAPLG